MLHARAVVRASFRAFVNHVVLDGPFTGDAAVDAATLLAAIREGRIFTSIDGLAKLCRVRGAGHDGRRAFARPGEYLEPAGPVAIEARIAAPEGTTLVLVKDGAPIYDSVGPAHCGSMSANSLAPTGSKRDLPRSITRSFGAVGADQPDLRRSARRARARRRPAAAMPPATTRSGFATGRWRAEAGEGSTSVLTPSTLADGTPALEWRFSLAGGPRARAVRRVHFPVDQRLAGHDRLQFRVQSDRPHRLWVQIRAPGDGGGERWGRTVLRRRHACASVEFRFSDFRPLGRHGDRPPVARSHGLGAVRDRHAQHAARHVWRPAVSGFVAGRSRAGRRSRSFGVARLPAERTCPKARDGNPNVETATSGLAFRTASRYPR